MLHNLGNQNIAAVVIHNPLPVQRNTYISVQLPSGLCVEVTPWKHHCTNGFVKTLTLLYHCIVSTGVKQYSNFNSSPASINHSIFPGQSAAMGNGSGISI